MRTTAEMRRLWSPPCGDSANDLSFIFWNGVAVGAHVRAASAFDALDAILDAWNYAPKKGQTWAYNCRRITDGSGYSLHAYGIGVDINSLANPYGNRLITDMPRAMVEAIEDIRTKGGVRVWRWGGDWNDDDRQNDPNYDAMHFEIQASPAELAAGIDWRTVNAVRADRATPTTTLRKWLQEAEVMERSAVKRPVPHEGHVCWDLEVAPHGSPVGANGVVASTVVVAQNKPQLNAQGQPRWVKIQVWWPDRVDEVAVPWRTLRLQARGDVSIVDLEDAGLRVYAVETVLPKP